MEAVVVPLNAELLHMKHLLMFLVVFILGEAVMKTTTV